jgi:4-hydroxythreonine-4-phosphate dehydrogenase
MLPRLAITTGEPAGIGPEISVAALDAPLPAAITLIGDADLIAARAALLARRVPETVEILHVPLAVPSVAGTLDVRNARYVLATLDAAIDGCTTGRFDAVVTAPVHKSVINEAGVPFSGHTEYLAERTSTAQVVMMLAGATAHGPLRVALATTHLPLANVSAAISSGLLMSVLKIIDHDLRLRFGIAQPRIAIAGLNPHAGESGHLGREEIEVLAPAIEQARRDGIDAHGPLPADTLFVPAVAQRFDALLAMYHDQGLPVLKYATFGHGVNVTLGLPFVRTSVDHGTALDKAGRGTADASSLRAALELAVELVARQRA